MAMDGRWVPMKRTALALHTLIRSRFRGDDLQLIGFGRHAEVMEIEELTALDAMWDKGTNLHHALLLANRHFRKHPNAQPVLLIVTDGEPTSHLEPDGEVYFSYPPHPLTVAYAVRELDNAGRLGAQTTFFRLGEDPGLARFIDSMAHRVDGRVVAPELDDLGAAVVGSYLGSRGAASPAVPYRGGYGDWFGGRGFWVGVGPDRSGGYAQPVRRRWPRLLGGRLACTASPSPSSHSSWPMSSRPGRSLDDTNEVDARIIVRLIGCSGSLSRRRRVGRGATTEAGGRRSGPDVLQLRQHRIARVPAGRRGALDGRDGPPGPAPPEP